MVRDVRVVLTVVGAVELVVGGSVVGLGFVDVHRVDGFVCVFCAGSTHIK